MEKFDQFINRIQPKFSGISLIIFDFAFGIFSWTIYLLSSALWVCSAITGLRPLVAIENFIDFILKRILILFVGRPTPDALYSLYYPLEPNFELLPDNFSQNLAYTSMMLSRLAYEEYPTIQKYLKQFNHFGDPIYIRPSTSPEYRSIVRRLIHLKRNPTYNTDTFVIPYNDGTNQVTFVVFRGAEPFNLVDRSASLKIVYSIEDLGQVHSGFWESLGFREGNMNENPVRTLEDLTTSCNNLVITGHGMGGALAGLYGLYKMNKWKEEKKTIDVFTFGQPRFGDATLMTNLDRIVQSSENKFKFYRFVNENDIVPRFPSYSLGFRHTKTGFFWIQNNQLALNQYDCQSYGTLFEFPPITFFSAPIKFITSFFLGESLFRQLVRLVTIFSMNLWSDHFPSDYDFAVKSLTITSQTPNFDHTPFE